jgi:uncharacterized protein YukE
MTGFGSTPNAIQAAGKTVATAASELRQADCGTPVAQLTAALPGSASAPAATDFADSWSQALGKWCDQATQHATTLGQVATNYANVDESNAQSLDPYGGGNYNIQSSDQQHIGKTKGAY